MNNLDLYAQMLRIRLIEEEIAKRYSEQEMRCPTHLSIGQEAVAVGISSVLTLSDKVFSSHRAHAHYLAKGGDLNKLIAELYGKVTGCTGGRGGSMHLCDLSAGFVASTAIVANSIPLAVGSALHQKISKKEDISVTYFGDGATEEGAFYESANFAVLKKLPALFICENNQYSVYSPLSVRQPTGRNITELSKSIGLEAIEVDGNDIHQVINAAERGVEYIKNGQGPVLIECHTYRHREHCGPNFDDDLNYRNEDEVKQWLARDPIVLMKQGYLSQVDEQTLISINKNIQIEINAAFEFAKMSKFAYPQDNKRFVYA